MAIKELLRGGYHIPVQEIPDHFFIPSLHTHTMADIATHSDIRMIQKFSSTACLISTSSHTICDDMRCKDLPLVAAYQAVDNPENTFYIGQHLLLSFSPDTPLHIQEKTLAEHRLCVQQQEEDHLVVIPHDQTDPLELSQKLQERAEVAYAEPNLYQELRPQEADYFPTDPLFARQWHLYAAQAQPQLHPTASVHAPGAWMITRGTRDIVVAVIDDGFDLKHPDLTGPNKIVHPTDYADRGNDPSASMHNRHGTPCAGIAIGEENQQGIVGVAPGCAWMPVRIPLFIDDATLYTVFQHTGKHAHVLSCSWGPVMPDYRPLPTSLSHLFHTLEEKGGPAEKGCIICVAAGNANLPISSSSYLIYRNGGVTKVEKRILNGLAAHPAIFTIAASTSMGRCAAYSNWGPEIDCCAPSNNRSPYGSHFYTPGLGIWTTDGEPGGYENGSQYTGNFGGTSSSTPLVAGIAALMLSENPDLSAREVKTILRETADKITDPDPDPCGQNFSTYDEKGHSLWFGYGKVNATRAVEVAHSYKTDVS